MTKSRISLTPLGMAKPKLPSDRPPVPVSSDDRWDISDDPAPSPAAVVKQQSVQPPSEPPRAQDPLRTTLALGDMKFPLPPAAPVVSSGGATSKPPSSAPGPMGSHRDAPPTPTLALESKGLHEMLVAKVAEATAERAAKEAAKAAPSIAPPSVGLPSTKPPRVGATTLALDDSPPVKAPSSAALPGHPSVAKSDRPAATTMVFTPSELVKAANAQTQAQSAPKEPRVGGTTAVMDPNPPVLAPVASTAAPSSAGRLGAPSSAVSKTLIEGGATDASESTNLRGTLVMAAPFAAMNSANAEAKAKEKAAETPAVEAPKKAPHIAVPSSKDALSSTIVGMAPVSLPASSGTALHTAPTGVSVASKGPVAAAKSAGAPLDSLAQTLAGTAPTASEIEARAREAAAKSQPVATASRETIRESSPSAPPRAATAPSSPPNVGTNTLRDGTPDGSSRTVTTPSALAATLAHDPVEEPVARKSAPPSQPTSDAPVSVQPRASRPVIVALTPTGLSEAKERAQKLASQRQTEDEALPEVGESALRIALAAAGTIVVSSAIPTLVRDPVGAATWTIPGVIALVMAFAPVGHATRALLAFAPALPALAVRAMGCEGHSVTGALALTALAVALPAALVFRAYFAGSKRSRLFVALALALGVLWAALPGGGAMLAVSSGPWAASHLPALAFLAVAALSVTSLLPGKTSGGARGWALLAILWTALPALGSRAEQFGPRALDALSLAGLAAIASTTLAALLSVYATPAPDGATTGA